MDLYGFMGVNAVMTKTKVSMTIEEDVFNVFKIYCQQNGMKISTKVEQMMKENLKDLPLKAYIK